MHVNLRINALRLPLPSFPFIFLSLVPHTLQPTTTTTTTTTTPPFSSSDTNDANGLFLSLSFIQYIIYSPVYNYIIFNARLVSVCVCVYIHTTTESTKTLSNSNNNNNNNSVCVCVYSASFSLALSLSFPLPAYYRANNRLISNGLANRSRVDSMPESSSCVSCSVALATAVSNPLCRAMIGLLE